MQDLQKEKMELPPGWKKFNFYALHLCYSFGILFALLQVGTIEKILVKAFKQSAFDILNGYVLIFFLVTASASGILGIIRSDRIKKFINLFENDHKGNR